MNPDGGQGNFDRERLLQDLLDGTLSGERREAAMIELRADPENAQELVKLRAALESMRDDGEYAPDFSPAILAEIGRRQGFLARSMRGVGTVVRVAAVVGAIATVGALAMIREESEGVLAPAESAPMTQVANAFERELGSCVRSFTTEAHQIGVELGEIPESARCFGNRIARASKPLAIEPVQEGRFLRLNMSTESEDLVVRGGHIAFEPFDLRIELDRSGSHQSRAAVWVVGSGSRWTPRATYASYTWPVVQAEHRTERSSSFGLGKDAGYP